MKCMQPKAQHGNGIRTNNTVNNRWGQQKNGLTLVLEVLSRRLRRSRLDRNWSLFGHLRSWLNDDIDTTIHRPPFDGFVGGNRKTITITISIQ